MTREQRLELLKQIEKDIYVCSLESTLLEDAKSCAIHSVIEELEQEPILDKIKAEIIKYEGDCRLSVDEYPSCKQCTDNVFKTIYGIFDKYKALEQEPTTKNNLGVDKFDKAINQSDLEEWIMETFPDWCEGDVRLIMNHMDEMPSVTPQEPKTGYLSIDDVMSVFDDFMCGEVDEDGTETFLEMLKDKAETEET